MSTQIDIAKTSLEQKLVSEGLIREDQKVPSEIFAPLDKIIRASAKGVTAEVVGEKLADYVSNIYLAKSESATEKVRTAALEAQADLKSHLGVDESVSSSTLGLGTVEKGLAKLGLISHVKAGPRADQANVEAKKADAADGVKSSEDVAAIADEVEFSKLKGEALNPLLELASGDETFQGQLLNVLENNPGTEARAKDFKQGEVAKVAEAIAEKVNSTDKDGLVKLIESLDPKMQFVLGNYLKDAIKVMQQDFSVIVQTSLDDAIEGKFKEGFLLVSSKLANVDPNEDSKATALKSRYMLGLMLGLGQELQARVKQDSDFDVANEITKFVTPAKLQEIEAKIEEEHGVKVKFGKEDVKALIKNLGSKTSGSSKETRQLDLMDFLKNNQKMVLGALPVVLAPLTGILSKLPFVGGIFGAVGGMVNQFAPYVFSLVISGGLGGGAEAKEEAKEEPVKDKPATVKMPAGVDTSLGAMSEAA